MSHMDELSALMEKLKDKEYREAYVNAEIVNGLSYQIQAMRLARNWTQQELAELLDTKQSVISRLENPDNESFSIKMLESLASIFDTGLMVRFVPFSKLAHETFDVKVRDLAVPSFKDDDGYITYLIGSAYNAEPVRVVPELPVNLFASIAHEVSKNAWRVITEDHMDSLTLYANFEEDDPELEPVRLFQRTPVHGQI